MRLLRRHVCSERIQSNQSLLVGMGLRCCRGHCRNLQHRAKVAAASNRLNRAVNVVGLQLQPYAYRGEHQRLWQSVIQLSLSHVAVGSSSTKETCRDLLELNIDLAIFRDTRNELARWLFSLS